MTHQDRTRGSRTIRQHYWLQQTFDWHSAGSIERSYQEHQYQGPQAGSPDHYKRQQSDQSWRQCCESPPCCWKQCLHLNGDNDHSNLLSCCYSFNSCISTTIALHVWFYVLFFNEEPLSSCHQCYKRISSATFSSFSADRLIITTFNPRRANCKISLI